MRGVATAVVVARLEGAVAIAAMSCPACGTNTESGAAPAVMCSTCAAMLEVIPSRQLRMQIDLRTACKTCSDISSDAMTGRSQKVCEATS